MMFARWVGSGIKKRTSIHVLNVTVDSDRTKPRIVSRVKRARTSQKRERLSAFRVCLESMAEQMVRIVTTATIVQQAQHLRTPAARSRAHHPVLVRLFSAVERLRWKFQKDRT